mgnify:CR=1 FL=1
MLVNQIINVEEDFGSGEVTEPVTLQQAKDYLRLEGFGGDDSGEQDFDFDDTLINSMIQEAREWVEKFTGQYIVPRSLTVVLLNQAGMIKLPGPVIGSIVFTDKDDTVIDSDDYDIIGTQWPKLETCYDERITADYEAGYETYPKWVENAILAYVADHYEFRGDDLPPAANERAAQICRPQRRVVSWA